MWYRHLCVTGVWRIACAKVETSVGMSPHVRKRMFKCPLDLLHPLEYSSQPTLGVEKRAFGAGLSVFQPPISGGPNLLTEIDCSKTSELWRDW